MAVGAGGGGGFGLIMAVVLAEVVTPATFGNLLLQLLGENDARHLNHAFRPCFSKAESASKQADTHSFSTILCNLNNSDSNHTWFGL